MSIQGWLVSLETLNIPVLHLKEDEGAWQMRFKQKLVVTQRIVCTLNWNFALILGIIERSPEKVERHSFLTSCAPFEHKVLSTSALF